MEETQETTPGQGQEKHKRDTRVEGMLEQEKRQSKANCPKQGRSKGDTWEGTEGWPRRRHDHKGTAADRGTHTGAAG